jgi:ABC-2 type transport system permease protein
VNVVILVIKNEIITKLTQRSFLFAAFGLPFIAFLIFGVVSIVNRNSPSLVDEIARDPATSEVEGYVDQSNLIDIVPPAIPDDVLIAYHDETTAQAALEAGQIVAYYLIPPDFMETGQVIYMRPDFGPFSATQQSDRLISLLEVNLLDGDVALADRIDEPFELEAVALEPVSSPNESRMQTFAVAYVMTLVFYFIIFGTASHNISSLTTEKENRVIEILMTSMTPRQMFTGKIIGLGIAGLLQAVVWIGSSFILIRLSRQTLDFPVAHLPASILVWGVIFFILGYTLYASLMASIGALVPNLREAAQAAFVVNSPLIVPLMLISILVTKPNGTLATVFSLIPFTAPVVMMTRLAASRAVPLWQILLAVALLILTISLVIRSVTGLFQAQTLLSGQPFNLRRFFLALAGRI